MKLLSTLAAAAAATAIALPKDSEIHVPKTSFAVPKKGLGQDGHGTRHLLGEDGAGQQQMNTVDYGVKPMLGEDGHGIHKPMLGQDGHGVHKPMLGQDGHGVHKPMLGQDGHGVHKPMLGQDGHGVHKPMLGQDGHGIQKKPVYEPMLGQDGHGIHKPMLGQDGHGVHKPMLGQDGHGIQKKPLSEEELLPYLGVGPILNGFAVDEVAVEGPEECLKDIIHDVEDLEQLLKDIEAAFSDKSIPEIIAAVKEAVTDVQELKDTIAQCTNSTVTIPVPEVELKFNPACLQDLAVLVEDLKLVEHDAVTALKTKDFKSIFKIIKELNQAKDDVQSVAQDCNIRA